MDSKKLVVSSTPHVRTSTSIESIMFDVTLALLPATVSGLFFFGLPALIVVLLAVGSSVLFEHLFQKAAKKPSTIKDYSAVVTGLLLALNLPATTAWYIPIIGSFFAIIIVKQLFGGLGQNFMNPALAARAFLLASYPAEMTKWTAPVSNMFGGFDAVSSATPLTAMAEGSFVIDSAAFSSAFFGSIGGCIGETSAIALLLGAAYLFYKRIISWQTPAVFLGTVFVLSLVLGDYSIYESFFQLFVGGLMLGAFFMATDYSSSPVTPKGQLIMGFGCGLLTVLIRLFGSYPEGVSYSILLMNLCVPLIDRYTRPRVYGTVKEAKNGKQ